MGAGDEVDGDGEGDHRGDVRGVPGAGDRGPGDAADGGSDVEGGVVRVFAGDGSAGGGVAAFDVKDGIISPGGVGYDIN